MIPEETLLQRRFKLVQEWEKSPLEFIDFVIDKLIAAEERLAQVENEWINLGNGENLDE